MPRLIQPSFAKGELGEDLYARVDVAAYAVGLKKAVNIIIHAQGGASNRSGLRFVVPCRNHTGTPPRIIRFKYNTEDAYVLEFSDLMMRVIRDDAHVLDVAKTITGATRANPVVITAVAHGVANGTDVYIKDVAGMPELNGRWFTAANVATDTMELTSQVDGANIDGTGYGAFTVGGTVSEVYNITTPYLVDDLLYLKHVQSANVMTLTHRAYPPMELSRLGHSNWTLEEISFKPTHPAPENLAITVNTTGSKTYLYKVTAIAADGSEESLAGLLASAKTVSATTAANPVVATSTSHGFTEGEEIDVPAGTFTEMTELNGRRFIVANATANTFELRGEDGTGYTPEATGGGVYATRLKITNGAATPDNTIDFDAVPGTERYSIYRNENGPYGWVGDTEGLSFTDKNMVADASITPPRARNPFHGVDNYPDTVSYYEQRRAFGSTNKKPDTKFYSVTGSASNMSQSSPRGASDAIETTLNSLEVNEIRHFVPGNDLLVLTSGSEWKVSEGTEASFSAETLRQKPQSSWGSSHLRPLVIGDKTLFVTENQSEVRSLGFQITIDGYTGNDMTIFSPQILEHNKAIDWAYSLSPDPLIYLVREDGMMGCLTFYPEQEVVAWTRWDTDGYFKRAASVRTNSDEVDTSGYFVVERRVGGQQVYYIERIASRRFTDVRDCFFVDSGRSYDVPMDITAVAFGAVTEITSTAHGIVDEEEVDIFDLEWELNVDDHQNKTDPDQINKGRYFACSITTDTFEILSVEGREDVTAATQADPIFVTAADHSFVDGQAIGFFNVEGMTELNGNTYLVSNATSSGFELTTLLGVDIDSTGYGVYTGGGQAYPAIDSTDFNAYLRGGTVRVATDTFGGMWHLEGRDCVALCDGSVEEDITITNGSFTLTRKYSRVHVGLRYVADIETLEPEAPGGAGTIQGVKKRVPFATLRVKKSRGLLVGSSFNSLTEVKDRSIEKLGDPTELRTGDVDVTLFTNWDNGGRITLRQINPLPVTLTGAIPLLDIGDI